jgi:hypothetical protein
MLPVEFSKSPEEYLEGWAELRNKSNLVSLNGDAMIQRPATFHELGILERQRERREPNEFVEMTRRKAAAEDVGMQT